MANTICLSTDMQTLYLIPNPGTRSTLSLAGNGVNVSLSEGDVTANRATKTPSGTETQFSTVKGNWTVLFDNTANALEFIGVDDMTPERTAYPLSGNASINIRRNGNILLVTS